MSASNGFETDILELIFQNLAIPWIGDAAGLQPAAANGSLFISLHTADPGEAGSQSTSEAGYTSYARVAVGRNTSAWSVSSNTVTNLAAITFPAATGGSATVTHFGIGSNTSGAGYLLFKGALGASLAVSTGITPQIPAANLVIGVE